MFFDFRFLRRQKSDICVPYRPTKITNTVRLALKAASHGWDGIFAFYCVPGGGAAAAAGWDPDGGYRQAEVCTGMQHRKASS
jgi:hypothetical protein